MNTQPIAPDVAGLLSNFADRGVLILATDDRLEVQAPRGVVQSTDMDELQARKADILAALAAQREGERRASTIRTPLSAPDPVSLPAPLHPLPWRVALARWPIDARERWGRRAGELQDAGHVWDEAERLAFEQVNGSPAVPVVLASPSSWVAEVDLPYPTWPDDPSATFGSTDIRRARGEMERKRADPSAPGSTRPADATPAPAPVKPCPTPGCHSTDRVIRAGTGPHAAKEICGACGAFVRWIGKGEAEGMGLDLAGLAAKFRPDARVMLPGMG